MRIGRGALVEALAVAGRGQRIGRGIARIERDRALEQRQRLVPRIVLDAVEQVEPAQHAFVGVEALGVLAHHAPQLALLHLRRDRRRHPRRQLVLQLEEIGGGAGEAVGPDRRAALAVAELGRQAHLVAGAVHAAGQHVAHGELAPHALRLVHLAAIAQHRGAADHDQLGQARERGDDGLDQPVGEPRGAAVLGLVDEGQHGDRGPPALEAVDDRRWHRTGHRPRHRAGQSRPSPPPRRPGPTA